MYFYESKSIIISLISKYAIKEIHLELCFLKWFIIMQGQP